MRRCAVGPLAWYAGSVLAIGCAPPPAVPPGPGSPSDAATACQDPSLRWIDTAARVHVTGNRDSLSLLPESRNHTWAETDIESGRVLALLVIERGSVKFRRHTASTGDSVCLYFRGKYPKGNAPPSVEATFVRKRDALPMESVHTRIRIGTPHARPEVDWVADYDSDPPAGMLPFSVEGAAQVMLRQMQTACPGGCCTAKKAV